MVATKAGTRVYTGGGAEKPLMPSLWQTKPHSMLASLSSSWVSELSPHCAHRCSCSSADSATPFACTALLRAASTGMPARGTARIDHPARASGCEPVRPRWASVAQAALQGACERPEVLGATKPGIVGALGTGETRQTSRDNWRAATRDRRRRGSSRARCCGGGGCGGCGGSCRGGDGGGGGGRGGGGACSAGMGGVEGAFVQTVVHLLVHAVVDAWPAALPRARQLFRPPADRRVCETCTSLPPHHRTAYRACMRAGERVGGRVTSDCD